MSEKDTNSSHVTQHNSLHYFHLYCSDKKCGQHIALLQVRNKSQLADMYLSEKIASSREWLIFFGNPARRSMPDLMCPNPNCKLRIGRPTPFNHRHVVRFIRDSFVKKPADGNLDCASLKPSRKVQVVCELNKAKS